MPRNFQALVFGLAASIAAGYVYWGEYSGAPLFLMLCGSFFLAALFLLSAFACWDEVKEEKR